MKLCPQCEFIYEDDQSFCDMDGKELVNNPILFAFGESFPTKSAQLQDDQTVAALSLAPGLTPGLTPSPVGTAASVPVNLISRRQPRNLAVAALAGLVLMALLFVVYYARTRQSHTRNGNRPSDQSNSQSPQQPETQSADTQHSAPDPASESAPSLAEVTDSEQTAEQSAGQSSAEAGSPGLTSTAQTSHAVPPASEKLMLRGRPTVSPVSARASSETNRASVVIRLTNGASIKADEAWEKKEGIWYRQAGMVTFLKRSRVRSIQRVAPSSRSQVETRPQTSVAQNQPRVAKSEIIQPKKESKMTSFLKKTGRVLTKPFKL